MIAKKGIIFFVLIAIIAVVGWKHKDLLIEKTEDIKIEMTADKVMNDLRKSDIEHFGEHTDRNEFDAILATIRSDASIIHIDSEIPIEEKDNKYIQKVFRRYTGIEDREKIKFASLMGPSYEEEFLVDDGNTVYSKDQSFAVLVLANSPEDAEIIMEQMKNNLKPWEWKTEDVIADDKDGQSLIIEVPHGEVTEDDMHFYRNGEYILFVINDKNAIEEGTQKSFEYMTRLLDKAVEESREYYASQEN